jgi:hypothetical protein
MHFVGFFLSSYVVFVVIVVVVVGNANNVSDKVVQSLFSFPSCIVWSSVFKEGLNLLPVLDRSRDHCYQARCSLWVGRQESPFISFLYHADSHGSNI